MSEIQYTSPVTARELIGNRRADTRLQNKLAKFVGGNLAGGPFVDTDGNVPAVFAEYLARPTVDNLDFLSTASDLGFEPWTITYRDDDFNTSNQKKASMARPKIALNDPGCKEIKPTILQNPQTSAQIGNLATKYGVNLGDFWEALRAYQLGKNPKLAAATKNVWDIGDWYKQQAKKRGWRNEYESKASYYYPPLMGLYAVSAALFVDYSRFPTFRYAEPAFEAARESLGVEPIIVRWAPQDSYPTAADPQRLIGKFTLDLTEESGLNAQNFDIWVKARLASGGTQ